MVFWQDNYVVHRYVPIAQAWTLVGSVSGSVQGVGGRLGAGDLVARGWMETPMFSASVHLWPWVPWPAVAPIGR